MRGRPDGFGYAVATAAAALATWSVVARPPAAEVVDLGGHLALLETPVELTAEFPGELVVDLAARVVARTAAPRVLLPAPGRGEHPAYPGAEVISARVVAPADLSEFAYLHAGLQLRDRWGEDTWAEFDGAIYGPADAAGRRRRRRWIGPGENLIRFRLAASDRPRQRGRAPWGALTRAAIEAAELKVYGSGRFRGRLELSQVYAGARAAAAPGPGFLRAAGPRPPDRVPRFGLDTRTFVVDLDLVNPFDPDEIDVYAEYRRDPREPGPRGGPPVRQNAFFTRELSPGRFEFMTRYSPPEAGGYEVRVAARYRAPRGGREATSRLPPARLSVGPPAPGAARGRVRVSAGGRSFEFENGEWFYPTGLNVAYPQDARYETQIRRKSPGLRANPLRDMAYYERHLPAMGAAGMDAFELWQSAWFLGLEWSKRWRGFGGRGFYNLANAARLDRLLARAAAAGLYVQLVIDNHGALVSTEEDAMWSSNPYNSANPRDGGDLARAVDFFTDPRAARDYKKRLRYIQARWGYSNQIFGFVFFNEVNLTDGYWGGNKPAVDAWHREMATYFRALDGGRHLLTTHYSEDYRFVSEALLKGPELDYVIVDAYHKDGTPLSPAVTGMAPYKLFHEKPYFINEIGGDWTSTSPRDIRFDYRLGLWLSFMTPAAGGPFLWWKDLVLTEGDYSAVAALRRFAAGEDKRGMIVMPASAFRLDLPGAAGYRVHALADRDGLLAWVGDEARMRAAAADPAGVPTASGTLTVTPLPWPAACAEVWDPDTGRRISAAAARFPAANTAEVDLPPFAGGHLALKLIRVAAGAACGEVAPVASPVSERSRRPTHP